VPAVVSPTGQSLARLIEQARFTPARVFGAYVALRLTPRFWNIVFQGFLLLTRVFVICRAG
jgi:hypothetical protein